MDGELGQVGSWGDFRMKNTLGKRRGCEKHKEENGEKMGRARRNVDGYKNMVHLQIS
jgi:hypothetical protein